MNECQFLSGCPVFKKCQTGLIKDIFTRKYCKGSLLEECERRKLKLSGSNVPETLLPNGEHLQHLAN